MDSEVSYRLLIESLAKKLLAGKLRIFSVAWEQSFFSYGEEKESKE